MDNELLKVGLTGGIASGKSTVASLFAQHGAPIIDADQISRQVVQKGSDGLAAVRARFGPEIIDTEGELNRAALRKIVFADPQQRAALESLLHPLIRARSDEQERQAAELNHPYVIFEIPLLLETKRHLDMDCVLVVDVPETLQIERVMQRDNCDETQARSILSAQTSREIRLQAADDVIDNSKDLSHLKQAVKALHQKYTALAACQ